MAREATPQPAVLLVDDEEDVLAASAYLLRSSGIGPVATLGDARRVADHLRDNPVAVIVLDLIMPHMPGIKVLDYVTEHHPEIPVIVMTALQEVEMAVNCLKRGAFDYLVKPVEESRFVSSVKHAQEMRDLRRQVETLRSTLTASGLRHPESFANLVTRNPRMTKTFQYVEAIARSPEPVLIVGETGTGKEMIAGALHALSGRDGEMVSLNAAGIDDQMFSDMLFGHVKGAFTGAIQDRRGMIVQAAHGTLFLDEAGDLPLPSQVKLLRLLQEGRYYPVGSDVPKISSARIIAATNRDLRRAMAEDQFRQDLFFRLSIHVVELPPLRERRDDIPLLVDHFIQEAATSLGKSPPRPAEQLFMLLSNHDFPGNVRELRALVFDAVARHRTGPFLSMESFRKVIDADPDRSAPPPAADEAETPPLSIAGRFPTLREGTRLLIDEAMRRAGGNQRIAAMLLGISRQSLNRRLRGLDPD